MSAGSEPRLLVLHAMRLKGFVEADAIAERSGLTTPEVDALLAALAADSLCQHRDGRVSGWSLSADGRAEHAKAVAAEIDAARCRDAVEAAYRQFLEVNGTLLAVCTDWQLRDVDGERVLNDHSDADYDAAVVARVREIDTAVQPICADITAALSRFGVYGPRLSTALERLEAGELQWFTAPLIDSYHTVWFELHEDLLCTLGIERAKEGGNE